MTNNAMKPWPRDEATFDDEASDFLPKRMDRRRFLNTFTAWTWLWFAISIALAGILLHERLKSGDDMPSVEQATLVTSAWSPILKQVEYEYRNFDNAFAAKSIYKGLPTQEREAAWRALWERGVSKGLRISPEQLSELNRTADAQKWIHASEKRGGGYFVLIELFHQLHCLDLVRQYTWKEYYAQHPDDLEIPINLRDTPVAMRMHVDHCIEELRQTLLCHGDVTPYLVMEDVETSIGSRADFSANHRCRKYEPIADYMDANAFEGVCREQGEDGVAQPCA